MIKSFNYFSALFAFVRLLLKTAVSKFVEAKTIGDNVGQSRLG